MNVNRIVEAHSNKPVEALITFLTAWWQIYKGW